MFCQVNLRNGQFNGNVKVKYRNIYIMKSGVLFNARFRNETKGYDAVEALIQEVENLHAAYGEFVGRFRIEKDGNIIRLYYVSDDLDFLGRVEALVRGHVTKFDGTFRRQENVALPALHS